MLQERGGCLVVHTMASSSDDPTIRARKPLARSVGVRMPEENRPRFWARARHHWSQAARGSSSLVSFGSREKERMPLARVSTLEVLHTIASVSDYLRIRARKILPRSVVVRTPQGNRLRGKKARGNRLRGQNARGRQTLSLGASTSSLVSSGTRKLTKIK